jgi:hypothetical protein
MDNKPPLFILCRTRNDQEYILHTGEPAFLAHVLVFDSGTTDIAVVKWLDEPTTHSAQRMAALMRRMGDWYQRHKENP